MKDRIVMDKAGTHYFLNDEEVTEKAYRGVYPAPAAGTFAQVGSVKPHLSDGLAVHPEQVEEAVASAKARGVPTEFLPDGRPIMRSRAHQKAYLRAYGFHNKDAGYGD